VKLANAPLVGVSRGTKQWALRRYARASWVASTAKLDLTQTLIGGRLTHHAVRLEADERQAGRRPPRGVPARRVAHDDRAAETEQGGGALGDDRWRPESSGDDEVVPTAMCGIPADHLGAVLDDGHPRLDAERRSSLTEKGAPASPGLNQRPQTLRPCQGEHEARDAGTGAEVDGPARRFGRARKAERVLKRLFYGAGTEEASALPLPENLEKGSLVPSEPVRRRAPPRQCRCRPRRRRPRPRLHRRRPVRHSPLPETAG